MEFALDIVIQKLSNDLKLDITNVVDIWKQTALKNNYCFECDIQLKDDKKFKTHCDKEDHLMSVDYFNKYTTKSIESITNFHKYYCKKCDTIYASKQLFRQHFISKKHTLSEIEYKQFKTDKIVKLKRNSEDSEQLVYTSLCKCSDIDMVERIGYTGSKYDIIYKFKDEKTIRQLQVKTLTPKHNKSTQFAYIHKEYYPDTLIVGINIEHNSYSLIFQRDVIGDPTQVNISNTKTNKYSKFLYTDLKKFEIDLYIKCKQSNIVKNNDIRNDLTKNQIQEYDSIKRLEKKCAEYKLDFKRNINVLDDVDIFIAGKKIQCKSTSKKDGNVYACTVGVNLLIDNKLVLCPYKDSSKFDFIICEITDNKGFFYILPRDVLIQLEIFITSDNKGKKSLGLALPNHKTNHWSKNYIDRFDLLIEPKKTYIYNLLQKFDENKINYIFYNRGRTLHGTVESKKFLYKLRLNNDIKSNKPIRFDLRTNDKTDFRRKGDFDFYIFELHSDAIYIIPEKKLLYDGLITGPGKSNSIAVDENKDLWSEKYKNRFDLLKKIK